MLCVVSLRFLNQGPTSLVFTTRTMFCLLVLIFLHPQSSDFLVANWSMQLNLKSSDKMNANFLFRGLNSPEIESESTTLERAITLGPLPRGFLRGPIRKRQPSEVPLHQQIMHHIQDLGIRV